MLLWVPQTLSAQDGDTLLMKKRFKPLAIGAAATFTGSMIMLNELWYKDFERESFHFFDDSKEWKQVDKAGHMYSAYHISAGSYQVLRWSGLSRTKALNISAMSSILTLTSIEVFDGFSSAYGASASDFVANISGTLLYYAQMRAWNTIYVQPKYSFRKTSYPALRPEVLGKTPPEQWLKDYNGQTYWLSINISRFGRLDKFPKWINPAIGYGMEDMIYANDQANTEIGLSPTRQYYLALDLDLSEIKSKSRLVNTLLYVLNLVHIPAPTLEFSQGEFKFHYFY